MEKVKFDYFNANKIADQDYLKTQKETKNKEEIKKNNINYTKSCKILDTMKEKYFLKINTKKLKIYLSKNKIIRKYIKNKIIFYKKYFLNNINYFKV